MMINERLIKAVHDDHHRVNFEPYKWAEIEISQGEVKLHIGQLRENGQKMTKLVTRKYYIDLDGNVKFVITSKDGG